MIREARAVRQEGGFLLHCQGKRCRPTHDRDGAVMSEPYLALQVIMMPRDANPLPTVLPAWGPHPMYSAIFGGVILSYIDQAGAVGARREVVCAGGRQPFLVTAAINRVEFRQPVLVGDVVRFLTRLVRIGRTSITVQVH